MTMRLNIGDVIVEFNKSEDADDEYTRHICRIFLVEGSIPGNGDWQAVCLTDTGYTRNIPYADLISGNGRYVIGGERAVMHAAGLVEERPALDLDEVERVKNWYDKDDEEIEAVWRDMRGGEDNGED